MALISRISFLAAAAATLFACHNNTPSDASDAGPPDAASDAGADGSTDADAGPPLPVRVGVNDVSVLFPLPASAADANALRLSTAGNGGPLFGQDDFDRISVFQAQEGPGSEPPFPYDTWRVVSARIDPCFPSLSFLESDPSMCRHQLRVVAQPISPAEGPGFAGFEDAAIHLLYDLSESDFRTLATAWINLGGTEMRDGREALGVSPRMTSEGLSGAYATGVRNLIVEYAGSATLSQFTFVIGRFVSWDFGGFRVTPTGRVPVQIHGIPADVALQTTTTDSASDDPFDVSPSTAEADGLDALSGAVEITDGPIGGTRFYLNATEEELAAAARLSFELDNPTSSFNPDTLDCSTCHLAGRARDRGIAHGLDVTGLPRYENARHNLEIELGSAVTDHVSQQRAFGYRGNEAMINHRVVNESAAVADSLEAMLDLSP